MSEHSFEIKTLGPLNFMHYYISRETIDGAREYLRKDGEVNRVCGPEGFYNTRGKAEEVLAKFNQPTVKLKRNYYE